MMNEWSGVCAYLALGFVLSVENPTCPCGTSQKHDSEDLEETVLHMELVRHTARTHCEVAKENSDTASHIA